jgi:hypothetical protein
MNQQWGPERQPLRHRAEMLLRVEHRTRLPEKIGGLSSLLTGTNWVRAGK